jgi:hypothetical protein
MRAHDCDSMPRDQVYLSLHTTLYELHAALRLLSPL